MCKKKYIYVFSDSGFTLIELLIVIVIIAVLATAIIISVSPGEQLAKARDVTRERHVKALETALYAYMIKNGSYPEEITATTETEICNTNIDSPICGDLIDLSVLYPEYISALPISPGVDSGDVGTGYHVSVVDNKLAIWPEESETGAMGKRVALGFDGWSDSVTIPHSNVLNFDDMLTVTGWFFYQGGINYSVLAKDTDYEVGENYSDGGINVRRALTTHAAGNMIIWSVTGDEDVNYGRSSYFLQMKINEKPSNPVDVIRMIIIDETTDEAVVDRVVNSDQFPLTDTYYWTYQMGFRDDFFSIPEHTYSVLVYYYGNIDIYIEGVRLERYHRPVVQRNVAWRFYTYGTVLQFLLWHPDGSYSNKSVNIGTKRNWVYFAGTYSSEEGMKIYINGSLKISEPPNGELIRKGTYDTWLSRERTPIKIRDIRIYDEVLSGEKIKDLYNNKNITNNPVGWWPISEGQGCTVYDHSGNENHGTLDPDCDSGEGPVWVVD